MAFSCSISEFAWILMFCFGLVFGLSLIGWKKYRQKKAKTKSVLVPMDQLRSKSPLNWKSLSSSLSSLSSNSAEMSGSTGLHKSNSINNEHRTATNGPVLSGYSYIDHCGMTQPLQTLPPYLLNHFGLRPQLSVVREDSQEQEVEMESTRSLDEIQSASAVSDRPAVSDLKVDGDSNFEVMSVLSSTHLLSCSDDSPVTMV